LKATLRGFRAKLNQTLLMFKHEPDLKIIVQYMGVPLLLKRVAESAYFGYFLQRHHVLSVSANSFWLKASARINELNDLYLWSAHNISYCRCHYQQILTYVTEWQSTILRHMFIWEPYVENGSEKFRVFVSVKHRVPKTA